MHTQEQWRPVIGFEGLYEVSDQGRVRRDRVLSPETTGGYLRVLLYHDGKRVKRLVHRLVAEAFIGPAPAAMQVNHRDGNKVNNALSNLEYVTRAENVRHARDVLGRQFGAVGARHHKVKLTDSQVADIRARYAAGGLTQETLAKEFGVSQTGIGKIVRVSTRKAGL